MGNISFTDRALEDYMYWQSGNDKKTLKRLNALIRDIKRSPFEGIGKPEPLRYAKSGLWSRRIDDENRVVYSIIDGDPVIYQCRGHYDDK